MNLIDSELEHRKKKKFKNIGKKLLFKAGSKSRYKALKIKKIPKILQIPSTRRWR